MAVFEFDAVRGEQEPTQQPKWALTEHCSLRAFDYNECIITEGHSVCQESQNRGRGWTGPQGYPSRFQAPRKQARIVAMTVYVKENTLSQ